MPCIQAGLWSAGTAAILSCNTRAVPRAVHPPSAATSMKHMLPGPIMASAKLHSGPARS
eukprot:CAMPEP_0183520168 /NCGR_PEP_ID=MMETSP0371-20130417/16709_1 /TAXON_ID=268820 /ORGANISM="Peridinium aciculiferum, Strain PAER-2" /LENGTH=58 /DNA_ID=CAMNT_0025718479 /DNA_START=99 /DNA_END=272 /DNA_ORIENTATION=-